ncbi:HET-domain-containing protein, partial [Amniculicola lignicola CBS 123094]
MWLRTCQEKHERCAQPNSYIPPRLLDVGTTESSIKLVETEGFQNTDTDFQYASVSHCWGQTRSKHILNHSNHSINLAGIPVSELPLTFRDAVSITRELGLRYLWIDSLCIVQDDVSDWVTHVEAMADVYRNAYITLAAGASLDDDGGFFRDARPTRTHSTPLTIIEEGVSYPLYIRQAIDHPENLWGFSLPLTERGWVFQERVLSRRYLCFGVDEVQWECLEDVACSCSTTGRGFNPRLDERIPRFPACEGTKMWFARLDKLDRENLAELWRNTVTLYSSRKLTYVKDKLPALAGLASYFKEVRKEEYLEGMWQSSLARDLCW